MRDDDDDDDHDNHDNHDNHDDHHHHDHDDYDNNDNNNDHDNLVRNVYLYMQRGYMGADDDGVYWCMYLSRFRNVRCVWCPRIRQRMREKLL